MRRITILLVTAMVALVEGGGLALAATVIGTGKGETLIGTDYRDTIRADGGDDVVRGMRGADRLRGGTGNDRVYGGRGDDLIRVNDGQQDRVDCGPGRDEVYYDNRDYHDRPGELVDCEIGNPPPIPRSSWSWRRSGISTWAAVPRRP